MYEDVNNSKKYYYGQLNNLVQKVTYTGLESETARVTVDNVDQTIKVDVIGSAGELDKRVKEVERKLKIKADSMYLDAIGALDPSGQHRPGWYLMSENVPIAGPYDLAISDADLENAKVTGGLAWMDSSKQILDFDSNVPENKDFLPIDVTKFSKISDKVLSKEDLLSCYFLWLVDNISEKLSQDICNRYTQISDDIIHEFEVDALKVSVPYRDNDVIYDLPIIYSISQPGTIVDDIEFSQAGLYVNNCRPLYISNKKQLQKHTFSDIYLPIYSHNLTVTINIDNFIYGIRIVFDNYADNILTAENLKYELSKLFIPQSYSSVMATYIPLVGAIGMWDADHQTDARNCDFETCLNRFDNLAIGYNENGLHFRCIDNNITDESIDADGLLSLGRNKSVIISLTDIDTESLYVYDLLVKKPDISR